MDINMDDDIQPSPLPKDSPSSTELSGPQESSSFPSTSQPLGGLDKGKCKMPEYEVEVHPDDSDPNLSAPSLDSEFGVPIMRTPRVKKVLTSTNEKLCCSLRAKNSITLYAYNEYMTHLYAFTMKVVAEQMPETPSLRHRLEGEKGPNRAKVANREKARKPRRKPKVARMLTKPKKAKPDVGRLTLELEGAC